MNFSYSYVGGIITLYVDKKAVYGSFLPVFKQFIYFYTLKVAKRTAYSSCLAVLSSYLNHPIDC